jgi:hypothetical protein
VIQPTQPIDERATMQLRNERDKALRLREAILALLRAWEEMYDLPRAVPTRREREG